VTYDGRLATAKEMKDAISDLGYVPKVVESRFAGTNLTGTSVDSAKGPIPEPVASAVTQAGDTGKLVFIDFYAEWCGACKILDRTTLKDPAVLTTLEQFVFLKVDADQYPDAIIHFKIVGMPTLVVLNALGEEVFRQVGPITADRLVSELALIIAVFEQKSVSR